MEITNPANLKDGNKMKYIIETDAYNGDSDYNQESDTLEKAIEEMVQERWILLARIRGN